MDSAILEDLLKNVQQEPESQSAENSASKSKRTTEHRESNEERYKEEENLGQMLFPNSNKIDLFEAQQQSLLSDEEQVKDFITSVSEELTTIRQDPKQLSKQRTSAMQNNDCFDDKKIMKQIKSILVSYASFYDYYVSSQKMNQSETRNLVRTLFKYIYETLFQVQNMDINFALILRKILRIPQIVDTLKQINMNQNRLKQHAHALCETLIIQIFKSLNQIQKKKRTHQDTIEEIDFFERILDLDFESFGTEVEGESIIKPFKVKQKRQPVSSQEEESKFSYDYILQQMAYQGQNKLEIPEDIEEDVQQETPMEEDDVNNNAPLLDYGYSQEDEEQESKTILTNCSIDDLSFLNAYIQSNLIREKLSEKLNMQKEEVEAMISTLVEHIQSNIFIVNESLMGMQLDVYETLKTGSIYINESFLKQQQEQKDNAQFQEFFKFRLLLAAVSQTGILMSQLMPKSAANMDGLMYNKFLKEIMGGDINYAAVAEGSSIVGYVLDLSNWSQAFGKQLTMKFPRLVS